jgi:hypothetical protein
LLKNRLALPLSQSITQIVIPTDTDQIIIIINGMLPAIIVEVKDISLKIVVDEKKTIGIALTLITDLVVTLITILALTTTIDPMIEGIIIVTLMIVLDLEKEIDHVTTTDLITILGIMTDQEAKKEVDLEIDIEAETEVMITETDLEADLQLLIPEKLML